MFFDFDAIYNETQGAAFASGKKRYYSSAVSGLITAEEGGKSVVRAVVRGAEKDHSVKIVFDEQGAFTTTPATATRSPSKRGRVNT